jgi:hypothetical protein
MSPLEIIGKYIAHGDMIQISLKTGIKLAVVSNHLNGKVKTPNIKIIQAALDIIEERRNDEKNINNRINQIMA